MTGGGGGGGAVEFFVLKFLFTVSLLGIRNTVLGSTKHNEGENDVF